MNPSLIKGDQALNFSFHKALWSYSDQLLQYIYLKAFESSIVLWCGFCCFAFLKLSILEIFLFPHPLSREKGNVEITDFQIFSHNFSSLPTFLPLTFTRLPNTPILFFFFSVPPSPLPQGYPFTSLTHLLSVPSRASWGLKWVGTVQSATAAAS